MSITTVSMRMHGPIAIIKLDKPEKLNSLTKDELYFLASLLREADGHSEIAVTLLIGTGRFFCAGADISQNRRAPNGISEFRHGLRETVTSNLNLSHAFSTHSKILVTALNGPVVGIAAAIIAFSDFIFAARTVYLLTPFSSLGLVAEGGASHTFVRRMGPARAKEALFLSKRISVQQLEQCGFVNQIFPSDGDQFYTAVLEEVHGWLDGHLNIQSILKTKDLLGNTHGSGLSKCIIDELFAGLDRQVAGIPQKEFEKLKKGEKKHRL